MSDTRKILLVDDEVYVLKAIVRVLRKKGWHVSSADSSLRALEMMKETDFHLVISDFRMPEMNGIEFLSLASELYPQTLQILLSGNAELEDLKEAVNQCQIQYFMTKPWDVDELLAVTEHLLNESEYLRISG